MTTINEIRVCQHGAIWSGHNSLTILLVIPFALSLGATNLQIGIIGAMPFLASLLTQIPGSILASFFRREKSYAICASISRSSWLFYPLIPTLFPEQPVNVLIIAYLITQIFESINVPAITSIMGDVVAKKRRGEVFSKKYRLVEMVAAICLVSAGFWLDSTGKTPESFSAVFIIGAILGIASSLWVLRFKVPKYKDQLKHKIREYFKLEGNFKIFVFFAMYFDFAFAFASPLFSAYLLRNLGLSYIFFVAALAINHITKVIVYPYWGKIADKLGDKPVAIAAFFCTSLIPVLYLFVTPETIWLVAPFQVLSGIIWAGAKLSLYNLLLDYSNPYRRVIDIASYQMYTSITLSIAPILGGWIADNVNFGLTGIPLVFTLDFLLRASSIFLLILLPEMRARKEHRVKEIFYQLVHFHDHATPRFRKQF